MVTADEADIVAVPASVSAETAPSDSSSSRRQSACTGTPTGVRSLRWPRMFRSTPTPEALTPILPTMPASVSVSTRRPSACSIVHTSQPSRSSSCQSQVWTPKGLPDAVAVPRQAMVEHSPADAARSSVRAFSAPISSTWLPLPWAMPSISSSRAGDHAAMRSSAWPPSLRRSSPVRPAATANRRLYTFMTSAIRSFWARPKVAPRAPGVRSAEWWRATSIGAA